jgi:hypothetical protein
VHQAERLSFALSPRAALLGACMVALLSGPLALLPPLAVVVLIGSVGLVAAVAVHPPLAAYLLVAGTLLTVGIDRGVVMPVLRPSEALLAAVCAGLVARGCAELMRGASPVVRLTRVDWSVLLLATTGSAIPLLWMVARGREISNEDVFYAAQLWKYVAVYAAARLAVRTERQVRTCLCVALAAASVVALVAIFQSLRLLGIPRMLAAYYTPTEDLSAVDDMRGTSTLSSSFAVADVMIFCLAVAAAWLIRGAPRRGLLSAACVLFVFGTVASGQFSGYLGFAVGAVALGLITRRMRQLGLASLALAAFAGLALWPVVGERLKGFDSTAGVPPSWVGRWENLTTFFWPDLGSQLNWLTGVRPAARVPAPETWREWVWIESGHTWLLWTGGLLFLVVFFAFLWFALRTLADVARRRAGAIGVAATGSFTALSVIAVLMTLDVHLTLRGAAELNFTLLALALTGSSPGRGAP